MAHAYNLAISVSTFALSSIRLNDNLENLWEFDMINLVQKVYFLHHHFFKFNIKYKIHTMKPSNIYLSKMYLWKNSIEQRKLMIEADCPYDFVVTSSNI